MILHAGLITRFSPGGWRGVLVQGASGSGKSDLMLRALDAGWTLAADDRVLVWTAGGRLWGRAPQTLSGLMEIRGLGVVATAARAFSAIDLVVACAPARSIERFPEPETEILLGCPVPRIKLAVFEPSAPAKLARALSHLAFNGNRRIKPSAPVLNPPGAGGVP